MAMRARVELRTGLTHTGNGRFFRKGQPQILTQPADIRYYQSEGSFLVTMLEAKPTPVEPSPSKSPPPTPQKPSPPATKAVKDETNDYTREELFRMKKSDLLEICEELGVESEGTQKELIARILKAQ